MPPQGASHRERQPLSTLSESVCIFVHLYISLEFTLFTSLANGYEQGEGVGRLPMSVRNGQAGRSLEEGSEITIK